MKYPEIYIRQLSYGEAELKLKKELDEFYLEHHRKIKIIHGKGKGILKQMVYDYIQQQPFVKKIYEAPVYYGGAGVSIVEFY